MKAGMSTRCQKAKFEQLPRLVEAMSIKPGCFQLTDKIFKTLSVFVGLGVGKVSSKLPIASRYTIGR